MKKPEVEMGALTIVQVIERTNTNHPLSNMLPGDFKLKQINREANKCADETKGIFYNYIFISFRYLQFSS